MKAYEKPTHLDLFSGIGGFSLAAERCGFETIGFSEVCLDASAVFVSHFRNAGKLGCIEAINQPEQVDLITGGVPCQPTSNAGEGRGSSDERWLWPEAIRIMRESRPWFAIFENPPALLKLEGGRAFNGIASGLAALGYDLWWEVLSVGAVGGQHLRERLFIICTDPACERQPKQGQYVESLYRQKAPFREADSFIKSFQGGGLPYVCRRHDGVPKKLAEAALRCLGNSVCPQVAEIFLKEIYKQITINQQTK